MNEDVNTQSVNNLTGKEIPKTPTISLVIGYILLILYLYPLMLTLGSLSGHGGTLAAGPMSFLVYFFDIIPLVIFLIPAYLLVRKSKKTLAIFAVILGADLLLSIILYSSLWK